MTRLCGFCGEMTTAWKPICIWCKNLKGRPAPEPDPNDIDPAGKPARTKRRKRKE